ncbi:MAG: hypothetical protein IID16_02605, partial [Candidatus Marinimicrobia bacterium]|nr:hypothetical protein [Candidatus Neomarinimicrobiota bacterium]
MKKSRIPAQSLRIIKQNNGFTDYKFFMDLIGWKRNRFPMDHAVVPILEDVLRREVYPRIESGHEILEVGDGPGAISEMIYNERPDLMDQLYVQAENMEAAIMDPFPPIKSDLSRGKFLNRKFDILIALQVFNVIPADQIAEQFLIAHG